MMHWIALLGAIVFLVLLLRPDRIGPRSTKAVLALASLAVSYYLLDDVNAVDWDVLRFLRAAQGGMPVAGAYIRGKPLVLVLVRLAEWAPGAPTGLAAYRALAVAACALGLYWGARLVQGATGSAAAALWVPASFAAFPALRYVAGTADDNVFQACALLGLGALGAWDGRFGRIAAGAIAGAALATHLEIALPVAAAVCVIACFRSIRHGLTIVGVAAVTWILVNGLAALLYPDSPGYISEVWKAACDIRDGLAGAGPYADAPGIESATTFARRWLSPIADRTAGVLIAGVLAAVAAAAAVREDRLRFATTYALALVVAGAVFPLVYEVASPERWSATAVGLALALPLGIHAIAEELPRRLSRVAIHAILALVLLVPAYRSMDREPFEWTDTPYCIVPSPGYAESIGRRLPGARIGFGVFRQAMGWDCIRDRVGADYRVVYLNRAGTEGELDADALVREARIGDLYVPNRIAWESGVPAEINVLPGLARIAQVDEEANATAP